MTRISEQTGSPVPRPGLAGAWDRLIGPGASAAEQAVTIALAAGGAIAAAAWLAADAARPSPAQYLVAALVR